METAVRKATRLEYQPSKRKHLQTLISATHRDPISIEPIMSLLMKRLKEHSWIITFKVLIIIHTLIREGSGNVALEYLARHPAILDTTYLREKSSNFVQVQNIRAYREYLQRRADAFIEARADHIKDVLMNKISRLKTLSVSDGLLKETAVLQKQITFILGTRLSVGGVENAISLHAYKLILEDLLQSFQALNESIVNILEHYFAMSKSDAQTSLGIYKRFARQTEEVIKFLDRARRMQTELQMTVPSLKHAPLSLASALEEYLNDADKETSLPPSSDTENHASQQNSNHKDQDVHGAIATSSQHQPKKETVDFFGSLQNEQTTVYPMPTGIVYQPSGVGFPLQQQPLTSQAPVQSHYTGSLNNPFRTGSLMPGPSMASQLISDGTPSLVQSPPATELDANPFRASSTLPVAPTVNHYPQPQFTGPYPYQHITGAPQPITGLNPFSTPPPVQSPVATGSSNPFNPDS